MNRIKAVVFDCDGVLFDTVFANRSYYNHILNHFGLSEMTDVQFAFCNAHTAEESVNYLFWEKPVLEDAVEYRKQLDYSSFIPHMILNNELVPLLEYLKPNYFIGIATNRTNTMHNVLKQFNLSSYFDIVVTARDVENPKPEPDELLLICDTLDLKPQEILFIGDTSVDESSASKANVRFVAFKNPALKADFHIDNLSDIKKIVE